MTFTLGEISTVLGLLIAAMSPLLIWIWNVSARLATQELKINTIWEFQMRRAISEAVEKNVGTLNSPFLVKPEVCEIAKGYLGNDLTNELKQFYKENQGKFTDPEMMIQIEHKYGNDLLKALCLPMQVYEGACLLIALAIGKEKPIIDLPLKE